MSRGQHIPIPDVEPSVRRWGWGPFRGLLVAVLLGMLSLLGCKEDVVGVLGTDLPFTLYGVLSPQLDSQWVRVYPIEDRLEPAADAELDAVFRSLDVQTGEEHVWRDSVIQDAFGQFAHVFWAPFRAEFNHTYQIAVENSTGDVSTVQTTVPPPTELVIQTAEITFTRVSIPVLVDGDAPRLLRVEVIYAVGFLPVGTGGFESDEVSISYDGLQQRVAEGWIIPINLEADFETVVDSVQRRIDRPIDRGIGAMLNRITVRLIVASEEWNPPGGVFDAEVLVQPDALTNVENGFGYVFSGYRNEIMWTPPDSVIEASRFQTGLETPGTAPAATLQSSPQPQRP